MKNSVRLMPRMLVAAAAFTATGFAAAQVPESAPAPAPAPPPAPVPAATPAPAPVTAPAPAAASAPLKTPQAAAAAAAKRAAHLEAGEPRAQSPGSDRVDLGVMTVTGNQELPKVLYIVPWKKSDIGDLAGKPMNSLLDEVLAPVDRDVFRREVKYYDAVHGGAPQNGASPTAASRPADPAQQVEK